MKHLTLEDVLAAFGLDHSDPLSLFDLPALLIPPVAGEDPRRTQVRALWLAGRIEYLSAALTCFAESQRGIDSRQLGVQDLVNLVARVQPMVEAANCERTRDALAMGLLSLIARGVDAEDEACLEVIKDMTYKDIEIIEAIIKIDRSARSYSYPMIPKHLEDKGIVNSGYLLAKGQVVFSMIFGLRFRGKGGDLPAPPSPQQIMSRKVRS